MSSGTRLVARVIFTPDPPKTKHYKGVPPELSGGTDSRVLIESPALLLILPKPDGVFLYRFTAGGRCLSDTWHKTIDEAKRQAEFEFDDLLSTWKRVPVDVKDVVAFGLAPE
jgi:hypothetical protein